MTRLFTKTRTSLWGSTAGNGLGSETVSYDALGNILSKTDVGSGSYRYGESHCGVQAGPHAVTYVPGKGNYCYDQNGNMTSGDSRTVQYTAFNKPERIQQGGEIATLSYGPDRSRFKRTDSGTQNRVTYYIGAYEKELRDGHTYHRIQLGDFAIVEKQDNQAETLQYTLRDDLGSLIGTVSETGEIKRLHFDPWGKRVEYPVPNVQATDLLSLANFITDRGFTGHEHLDNVGLIHMNGRVYDPEIARFISADPVLQSPTHLQSYNRYSYVWNNPLRMTDPSGYFSLKKFGNWVGDGVKKAGDWAEDNVETVVIVAATIYTGGAAAAWASGAGFGAFATGAIAGGTAGFVGGGLTTGTWEGAVQGALVGAATGAVGGYLSSSGLSGSLAQGLSGGMNGYLQTGDMGGFVRGFVAGQVPIDLGSESYYTNQYTNFAINRTRDAIQGYIINGKQGARSNLMGGLMNDAVGHAIGAATAYANNGHFKGPNFRDGMYFYDSGDAIEYFGPNALTVGNVVSGPKDLYNGSASTWLHAHEVAHYREQSPLGSYYLPIHIASQWGGETLGTKKFMEYGPFHSNGYRY